MATHQTMSTAFDDILISDLDPSFKQFMCDRLVDSWKPFIRFLPLTAISEEKITEIFDSNDNISEKSYQAFDVWLKANPEARWSHVRDSLIYIKEKLLITQWEKELSVILNETKKVDSKAAI